MQRGLPQNDPFYGRLVKNNSEWIKGRHYIKR